MVRGGRDDFAFFVASVGCPAVGSSSEKHALGRHRPPAGRARPAGAG